MTEPTIEEMAGWLAPTDFSGMLVLPSLTVERAAIIRDHLLAQQANTLPLDEVPEKYSFSSLYKQYTNSKFFYVCRLLNSQNRAYEGSGKTPAEALRAAIARAKEPRK